MKKAILLLFAVLGIAPIYSQTDFDGLFMDRNYLCVGMVGSYSSFTHYWEGENKRDNLNMGTVSNSSLGVYGGIHYRADCEVGLTAGNKVGAFAIKRALSDGAE